MIFASFALNFSAWIETIKNFYKIKNKTEIIMIDESIFNTTNLEEIPEEVSKELKEQKGEYATIFKEMFEIKKELSLNELIIGAYRGYGKQISRKLAARICYSLVNLGILSSAGAKSGVFILNTNPIKKQKNKKKSIEIENQEIEQS